MKKKSIVAVSIAIVLLGAGWGVSQLMSRPAEQPQAYSAARNLRVVDIDGVVGDPEKYPGIIGVKGTVSKVDESNSTFTLGCEDACILMPVKFEGRLPKEGANIIAIGTVKRADNSKFVFVAREIKAQ